VLRYLGWQASRKGQKLKKLPSPNRVKLEYLCYNSYALEEIVEFIK
jgi:hypothetical protein